MPQFDSPLNLPLVEPTPARLETPLGTLALRLIVDGEEAELREQFGEGLPCLRRFELGALSADLLMFSLEPKLPAEMRVDRCVAAVWRVRAQRDIPSVTLRAEWEDGARLEDGGPECSEHLTALTWYAPEFLLSLGTSDEEALAYAAKEGLLPTRLADVFLGQDGRVARFIGEWDGLLVELPPLLAGESAQVHMIVAWRTGEMGQWECAPWYAVDVAPREVARLADEALAPTA